jgi:branched-subunit amino acid transport protein
LTEFYLILGMMLVTFPVRYTMFALSSKLQFSPEFQQILGYVPVAILTAIVIPAILMPQGDRLFLSYTNPRLLAGLITLGVGWWRGNLLLTIVVGMVAFLGFQWLLSSP